MRNTAIILTDCIKEIKAGKATVSDCLERYPSVRSELEPLLELALGIREPDILPLDNNLKQNAKVQLLQQIDTVKQEKSRSFSGIFNFGLPPRFAWARVAITVIIAVIIISSLAGGTAYAAQDSLPGDFLYPVKISTEDARLLLAGDNEARVKLNLQFARRRLEEMDKLVSRNEEKAGLALNGYQDNLNAAAEQVNGITDTSSLSNVLDLTLADLNKHTAYCDSVIDTGAPYLGPVREASSFTVNTQVQLMRTLEKQNIVQAAQSNVNAMQNRLQRAFTKAGEDEFQVMQQALLQYQQFNRLGEEILRHAQSMDNHSAEVEALNLQALPACRDILDSISLEVPHEYRNTVEACRELTEQFETQARYRYRFQNESGSGEQMTPPGNGEGHGTGQDGQAGPQYRWGNTDNGTPENAPASSPVGGQNMGNGNMPGNGEGPGPDGGSGTGEENTDSGTGLDYGPGGDTGAGGEPGSTGGGGAAGGGTGSGGTGSGGGTGSNGGSGTGGGKP